MIVSMLLAAAAACPQPQPGFPEAFDVKECPQVWQIAGHAPIDKALNLLVVGDAFRPDELRMYRCAAGLTVEELLANPPFSTYRHAINVYRMDLATKGRGVSAIFPETCGSAKCEPDLPVWPNIQDECQEFEAREQAAAKAVPMRPADQVASECMTIGFHVRACPDTAQECQLIWPSGEGLRKLWRLAACAPAFDAIIMIVNSGNWAGGGTADMHPPLAITTLVGIDRDDTRDNLLAHELGHGLGLLDEYASSVAYSDASDKPTFAPGRNVVMVGADGTFPPIPWAASCDPPAPGAPSEQGCQKVCLDPNDPELKGPKPACTPPPNVAEGKTRWVGLIKGGFYAKNGVYHAEWTCTMLDANTSGKGFCAGCQAHFHQLVKDMISPAPTPTRP